MVVLGKGGKRRVTDVKEVDGEGGVPLTQNSKLSELFRAFFSYVSTFQ